MFHRISSVLSYIISRKQKLIQSFRWNIRWKKVIIVNYIAFRPDEPFQLIFVTCTASAASGSSVPPVNECEPIRKTLNVRCHASEDEEEDAANVPDIEKPFFSEKTHCFLLLLLLLSRTKWHLPYVHFGSVAVASTRRTISLS